MSSQTHGHVPCVNELLAYMDSQKVRGRYSTNLGDQERPPFIPLSTIVNYFEAGHSLEKILNAVLGGVTHANVRNTILKQYLKVFCILLYIDKGPFIGIFLEKTTLTDFQLPFTSKPEDFPISTANNDLYKAFYKEQWTFCPASFQDQRHLDFLKDFVLPITEMEAMSPGQNVSENKPTITRVKVHADFFQGFSSSQGNDASRKVFVMKTYRKAENKTMFENELDAFGQITRGGQLHRAMIGFHGAFTYKETYNLLLEYANQGTLEEYLMKADPPCNFGDIHSFWTNLLDVVDALQRIHEINGEGEEEGIPMSGVHQDIKPANILVVGSENESTYNWKFKLGDLGLAHFKVLDARSGTATHIDNYGTKTYGIKTRSPYMMLQADGYICLGAPECYRANQSEARSRIKITSCADIYSLGAVFSEVVTWLTHGKAGVSDYDKARVEAHNSMHNFRNPGCFHDGYKTLDEVWQRHEMCRQAVRRHDNVTTRIIDEIDKMLDEKPRIRPAAFMLVRWFTRELNRAVAPHVSGSPNPSGFTRDIPSPERSSVIFPAVPFNDGPESPEEGSSSPSGHLLESSTPRRLLTINSVRGTITSPTQSVQDPTLVSRESKSKGKLRASLSSPETPRGSVLSTSTRSQKQSVADRPKSILDGATQSISPPKLSIEQALHWQKCKREGRPFEIEKENLLSELGERDIVFLFDESPTMKVHQQDAVSLVSVLAYMLKDRDPDGMELRFVGAADKKSRYKHSSRLTREVEKASFSKSKLNIAIRLEEIIGGYEKKLHEGKGKAPASIRKRLSLIRPQTMSLSPLNLYIFTDGVWQPKVDPSSAIKRLANVLDALGMSEAQVGIQFIRFGDDKIGMERLEYLDSKKRMGLKRDIVDTTPFKDANIWKIILGATNKWFDDDPNEGEFDADAPPEPFPGT